MTDSETSFPIHRNTPLRGRSVVCVVLALTVVAMIVSSCRVESDSVDAGAPTSDVVAPDCPAWANDVLSSDPAAVDGDADDWRDHFVSRSVLLAELAEQLPATDAAPISAFADAVREFGYDPMSPGASRRMGEAAADAATVAVRSC